MAVEAAEVDERAVVHRCVTPPSVECQRDCSATKECASLSRHSVAINEFYFIVPTNGSGPGFVPVLLPLPQSDGGFYSAIGQSDEGNLVAAMRAVWMEGDVQ